MAKIYCSDCGNKTNAFTRIKFADGYLCGKCMRRYNLKDTVLLRSWAKKHSYRDAPLFNKGQSKLKQQIVESQRPKCPHCGSHNITPLGQHKKAFSVGKAVGGAILTGGIGAVAGFAGKKTKKVDYVCNNCGKTFVR